MTPPAPIAPASIALDGVAVALGGRVALEGVAGVFAPGGLTAVVGPNGAGKTTLLRAIAGLHAPSAGRIDRGGMAPGAVALLPQAAALDRAFPICCLDAVALGAWRRVGPWRRVGGDALDRAAAALAAVDLRGLERRPVGALSAGQFQRVMFARLIVQDAPVLLLDEPFNAVDEATAEALLALVLGWHAEGRTVICVLHDLALVRAHFPRALLLARRPIAWGPTAEALRPDALDRARLAAWGPPPPAGPLRRVA